MTGVVSLKPIINIQDESFMKLTPKITLTNSSLTDFNAETTAIKIPNQFCFLFGVYCEGFVNLFNSYEIKVEVNGSILILVNLKKSHFLTDRHFIVRNSSNSINC